MRMGWQELSDIDEDASDVQSLVSSDESAVTSTASEVSDISTAMDAARPDGTDSSADSDTILRPPRKAAHTHTMWENEYFVLTNNPNYNDVRGRLIVCIPRVTRGRATHHSGAQQPPG